MFTPPSYLYSELLIWHSSKTVWSPCTFVEVVLGTTDLTLIQDTIVIAFNNDDVLGTTDLTLIQDQFDLNVELFKVLGTTDLTLIQDFNRVL